MTDLRVVFDPFTFPDNSYPYGLLPKEMGAQACWYNFIKLHRVWLEAGKSEDQVVLEGDEWKYKRYIEIKRATGILYGLDPSHIDKFWPAVQAEARRLGKERELKYGQPFDQPQNEYMVASPGMVFEGHAEKK